MELDSLDEIIQFGKIRQFINQGVGMVLIEPNDPIKLFDIENIVCFGDKNVVGFIYELVGQITDPLYSIQLYPEFVDKLHVELNQTNQTPEQLADLMKEKLHGRNTFVVKRTMKIINARLDDLLKQKGCDAGNMFDEEIPASD